MRALVLVASRELRAYAPAWIAALVAATLPWLAPLLPKASGQPAAEVRLATAIVLATLLGLLVAVLAGAGLLSRDLAEGRMGFFLALPLRAGTVWGGRLLAAATLVYVTIAAVLLPVALAGGESTPVREVLAGKGELRVLGTSGGLAMTLLALAPLLLLLVSHQLATALRSRTPWLLVDLAALALAAVVIGRALAELLAAWAATELSIALTTATALAVAALASGGAFGLARGGVLLGRVHRAQASAVAVGLLAAAALTAGYSRWALAVEADDLTTVRATVAAPHGSWLAVAGSFRHRPSYAPWMLVDAHTGASLPLSAGIVQLDKNHLELPSPVVFADDGRSAVWLGSTRNEWRRTEAIWLELGPRLRQVPTGIEVRDPWSAALLPAGENLVVAERRRLSWWSATGRRLVAAGELPSVRPVWQELRMLAPQRVRLARLIDAADGPRLQVFDLDASARRLERRVDQALGEGPPALSFAADGARLLVVGGWGGRGGVALLDAATGATVAKLAAPSPKDWLSATFLPGGRVGIASGRSGVLTLRVFDREGALAHELPLGTGRWTWLGAAWGGDLLPFTASSRLGGGQAGSWRGELRLVDLASGRVRVLGERLTPVVGAFPWSPGDDRIARDAPAARLFRTADDALVRIDDAGRQTRVLPRPG
jgi:hypothetical protein